MGPPLVGPARPQADWNVYDSIFEMPRFDADKIIKPATINMVFNYMQVQKHKEFLGRTVWRRAPTYTPHPAEQPSSLQDHDQPVRLR